ncbi:MAG: phosphoribosyl-AMP cyclohydrolase [Endomicrobium sp.]|nr:phosphoribosyl-AMP cyclohydrolase [Endomicrobium sp.]
MSNFSENLKFDNKGLIPVVVQDFTSNIVLMVAYMNKEAIKRTLETKKATFWSRSRKTFWVKGETSGNIQKVKEFYYDCDGDCILLKVNQIGSAACHTGHRSCFFTKVTSNGATEEESSR